MQLVGAHTTAVLVGVLCSTALAQPKDAAQSAYEEGRKHYDLREWDQAISKFKEAYRLRADAPSLFNIAQAYRLKGDCREAVSFYKTYVRNFPSEKGADKAQKFVAELGDCKDQAPAEPTATPPPVVTPPPVTTEPPVTSTPSPAPVDAPSSTGRGLRLAGVATGAVGLVALGAGVYFGLSARGKQSDLEDGGVWDPALYEDGQSADRNAKIFLGVGGAAVIGGAVLYYLGVRAGSEAQVAVVPRGDGATMVWSCAF